MAKNERIEVVCALILDQDRILLAQKKPDSKFPLLWEFPGGKIEPGESAQTALVREIQEELNCTLDPAPDIFLSTEYDYEFIKIRLHGIIAKISSGAPEAREHAQISWWSLDEISENDLVPADLPLLRALQRHYAP